MVAWLAIALPLVLAVMGVVMGVIVALSQPSALFIWSPKVAISRHCSNVRFVP